MHSDPISDMLTRVRNALAARHKDVTLPYSKNKLAILNILNKEGYLEKAELIQTEQGFKAIKVGLKYEGRKPIISSLQRISIPSMRVYLGKRSLPVVLNNMGIAIISTSKGLMTNKEARKKGLGGEIICEIY